MKYRIIDPSDWGRLKDIVGPEFIPNPNAASAAIAEDDSGKITGVLFLQLAVHMEPLILQSPQVSFRRLYETLLDAIEQDKGLHFYVFSDKEIIDRMAEHVGMKPTAFRVFEGEVR